MRLPVLLALALFVAGAGRADLNYPATVVIGFDDLSVPYTGQGAMPSSYGSLSWSYDTYWGGAA